MSIQYRGDYVFRQCTMPVWKAKQTYEIDECSLTYNGGALLKEAFIDLCAPGQTLAYKDHAGTNYSRPKMFVVGLSDDGHLHQPRITLALLGFRSGTRPEPQYDNCLISSSVSTTRDTGSGNQTLTYRYRSARSRISWWTDEEPDPAAPEFNTTFDTTDPLNPTRFIGRSISGVSGSTIDLGDFIALFNLLTREMQVSDFQITPVVPGELWQCSVNVEYVLVGT